MMWSNGFGWWMWLTMGGLVIAFWVVALLLVLTLLRTR